MSSPRTVDAPSVEALHRALAAGGFEVQYTKEVPATTTTSTTPSTTTTTSPDNRANFYSTIGQIGVPLAAGLAKRGMGGKALAALGAAGGLAGAALGRRGLPTLGDVGTVAAGEAVPPVATKAVQATRAIPGIERLFPRLAGATSRVSSLMDEGVSGTARRLKIPLTAGQRFGGKIAALEERLGGVSPRMAETQEAEAGRAVADEARRLGGAIAKNPVQEGQNFIRGLRRAGTAIEDVNARGAYLQDLRALEMDPYKLTTPKLEKIVMQNPLRVRQALNVAKAAGARVDPEAQTTRLWLSNVLHSAVKPPKATATGYFQSAGGFFDLDARAFRDAWRAVPASDHLAFGKAASGLEKVVQVIDRFPKVERARVPVGHWFSGGLKEAARRNPMTSLAIAGLIGEEASTAHLMNLAGAHPVAGAGTAAGLLTVLGTRRGARAALRGLMATEPGARLFAAGLDMQRRGVPETVILGAFGRELGRMTEQAMAPQGQQQGLPQLGGGQPPLPRSPSGGEAADEFHRADGSLKGPGFLGSLPHVGGKTSTELSIGVNIDGREMEIPSLVPGLTQQETNHLLQGGKPTKEIVAKAVAHARQRMAQGLSPFKEGTFREANP